MPAPNECPEHTISGSSGFSVRVAHPLVVSFFRATTKIAFLTAERKEQRLEEGGAEALTQRHEDTKIGRFFVALWLCERKRGDSGLSCS